MNELSQVCSFESRRRVEMAKLIQKFGGEAFVAPSMQEVPLSDNVEAAEFGRTLLAGGVDVMVFLTGVGATALRDIVTQTNSAEDFCEALERCSVCVRGPKPAAVLKDWGVPIDVRAPSPNTWRELVAAIDDSELSLASSRVAIQEYGQPSSELREALEQRGATVTSVVVYRWTLPDDTQPLETAVRKIAAGDFDIVLVTSAQQMRNAVAVAEKLGLTDEFRAGLDRVRLGSIGPTATEALLEFGMRVDVQPENPKMAPLVRAALSLAKS